MPGGRRTPALFLLVSLVLFLNAAAHFAHRRTARDAAAFAAPQDDGGSPPQSPRALLRRGAPADPSSPPPWIAAASDGGGAATASFARPTSAAGKTACDGVHLQPDKCNFVRENCNEMVTGMFNYLEFYYCSAAVGVIPFVALVCWLLILFALVGIAASEFFCPNLGTIARSLRMSENMAGVTFLAFGNGSPDLFSTFSALSAGSGGLALGELVGAASFIVNVVVGSMAVISPFQVAAYPFFRDMLFFVGAVAFLAYTAWDQRIALVEGIILIAYYLLYVTIVVAGGWLRQRCATRYSPLIEASEAESPVLTAHEDEHNQYGEEHFDEYSQTQPLLGKTPTTERPRLFGFPLTTDEVGSSLMFRKRIQHHRRKSFLGAFEFRDAIQSWKQCDLRPNAFSAIEGFSPTRPRPPRSHRRERSNASFDPACGRVVERPVFVRSSTYTGDNSPGQLASAAVVSQGFSRGGSPLQSAFPRASPLKREAERRVVVEGENSSPPRLPVLDSSPEQVQTAVPSIAVSTPGGGPRTRLSIDTSRVWLRHSRAPCTPDEHVQVDSVGLSRDAPPSSPLRLVLLQTPSIPEDNVVATDYFPGVHAAPVEEETPGPSPAGAATTAAVRPLKDILFPHLTEWRYRSLSSKIAGLIATPLVFLLIITVPVVDEDEEVKTPLAKSADPVQDLSHSDRTTSYTGTEVTVVDDDEVPQELYALKWNRGLTVAQFAIAPLFVSSALLAANPSLPSSVVGIGIIVGLICSILCYSLTSMPKVAAWYRYLCFVGFAVAIVWVYFVANEVVGLLQAFGLILGLSEAIVGLTVFAMGNSLGDFVANVTIARMGFPVMAISACFGGPLLNILLGVGLSSTYLTATTGTAYQLHDMSPTIFMSSFVLLFSLLSSLVIVPLRGYRLTRSYGYYLIVLYVVGMSMNVSTEIYRSR